MSQEANFSVTVKTPKGNLVTVRGDTTGEWLANLRGAGTSGALGVINQIERSLAGEPVQPAPAGQPATDGSQATPAAAASQPGQELPPGFGVKCDTCGAATRFEQEGISKKSGAPFKRYSCTASALHKATFTN